MSGANITMRRPPRGLLGEVVLPELLVWREGGGILGTTVVGLFHHHQHHQHLSQVCGVRGQDQWVVLQRFADAWSLSLSLLLLLSSYSSSWSSEEGFCCCSP